MKEKLILEGVLQKFDNIRNRGRIYYTKEEFDIQIKEFNERILRKKNELRKKKLESL
ncbi:hypothetical protein M0Q50_03850 [bacterium]|jgi:hypothetical protein|nr:hypothetical protein [bacterium]